MYSGCAIHNSAGSEEHRSGCTGSEFSRVFLLTPILRSSGAIPLKRCSLIGLAAVPNARASGRNTLLSSLKYLSGRTRDAHPSTSTFRMPSDRVNQKALCGGPTRAPSTQPNRAIEGRCTFDDRRSRCHSTTRNSVIT